MKSKNRILDAVMGLCVADALGVPVEFNVATILFAICALFPTPTTTNFPFVLYIAFTASTKDSLIREAIASSS